MNNKQLIDKYPWLLPRNVWTDKISDDYDYSYTWLDDMPKGWRIAFGDLIVEDIDKILKENNCIDNYRIRQIKEKFGELRWYDNNGITLEIIDKYSVASRNICIYCGKPDVAISNGYWVYPCCEECFNDKVNTNATYAESFDIDDSKMSDVFSYSQYSKDKGWVKHTLDISDVTEKIRKKYYNDNRRN